MPSDALDIVALDEAKRELRLVGTDQDPLLTSHIQAAVGLVSQKLDRPLLTRTGRILQIEFPGRHTPITLDIPDISEVTAVDAWSVDADTGGEPDVGVSMGRLYMSRGDRSYLYPPEDGWIGYVEATYSIPGDTAPASNYLTLTLGTETGLYGNEGNDARVSIRTGTGDEVEAAEWLTQENRLSVVIVAASTLSSLATTLGAVDGVTAALTGDGTTAVTATVDDGAFTGGLTSDASKPARVTYSQEGTLTPEIKQAILLVVCMLFDGMDLSSSKSLDYLLAPYVRVGL